MTLNRSFVFVSTLLMLAVGIGCGKPSHIPELGDVMGTVTMDGQALANATVTFAPNQGRPSFGTTDTEGQYTLSFIGDYTGAIIGTHTVRISTEQYVEQADGTTQHIKESIPRAYNTSSTLTADVQPGENRFDFELSSKPTPKRR